MHCGYLDRHGRFLDCSHEYGPFKHESYCHGMGIDEDYLMGFVGWVKLTPCLPDSYLYTSPRGLTKEQEKWLVDSGYEVDEWDRGDVKQ